MNEVSVKQIISSNIRRLRDSAGLTQEALGKAAHVSGRYISQIESDTAANLTIETLESIAKVLGVAIVDLVSSNQGDRLSKRQSIEYVIKILEDQIDRL